ncbi:MAG: HAD family hydrolase, partial [Firmicutes bacterium]|nr:HAD family hydrolase [Bacillota bacterium]
DAQIFLDCAKALDVKVEECIFVGDGGSQELYGARNVGMSSLQAGWYLMQSGQIETRRQEEFSLLIESMDLLKYIE